MADLTFSFGDMILRSMQEEARTRLQKQQMELEERYRTGQLSEERARTEIQRTSAASEADYRAAESKRLEAQSGREASALEFQERKLSLSQILSPKMAKELGFTDEQLKEKLPAADIDKVISSQVAAASREQSADIAGYYRLLSAQLRGQMNPKMVDKAEQEAAQKMYLDTVYPANRDGKRDLTHPADMFDRTKLENPGESGFWGALLGGMNALGAGPQAGKPSFAPPAQTGFLQNLMTGGSLLAGAMGPTGGARIGGLGINENATPYAVGPTNIPNQMSGTVARFPQSGSQVPGFTGGGMAPSGIGTPSLLGIQSGVGNATARNAAMVEPVLQHGEKLVQAAQSIMDKGYQLPESLYRDLVKTQAVFAADKEGKAGVPQNFVYPALNQRIMSFVSGAQNATNFYNPTLLALKQQMMDPNYLQQAAAARSFGKGVGSYDLNQMGYSTK